MKPYYFFSILCFLFEGNPALSRSPALRSQQMSSPPSVELPPSVAADLFGSTEYSHSNNQLNCYALLNKTLTYPNAQSTALCNEAEISCIRYGLLQQFITAKTNKDLGQQYHQERFDWEALKQGLASSLEDVKLKLAGCAVALEAGSKNSLSILEQSGFAPTLMGPLSSPNQPLTSRNK